MTLAVTPAPHRNVRLVKLLTDLAMIEEDWPQRDFADRLGLMLNFADSIVLADAHKVRPERGFVAATDSAEELKQAVLHTKSRLVQGVIDSCTGAVERPKIRWPKVTEADEAISFERFQRFYLAHQLEQDQGVRLIRASARDALSGCTPALKKLALLDQTLEDTLWEQTRRFFALIPALLERRFDQLQASGQEQDRWLLQLARDIQALLLAELDLRLQPVLGLVEALETELEVSAGQGS